MLRQSHFRRWMATNQNMRSHPPKLSNCCPIRINDLMPCCRGNKILSFKGSKCFLNLFSQIQSSLAHQQISQWTTKLTQRFFIAFGRFIVSVIDLNFMHLRFWSWKYWFGGCSICSDNLWQSVMLVVTICGFGGDDQLQFVLVSHSAQVRGKPNGVLLVAHLGRFPYDHKYGTIMFLFF